MVNKMKFSILFAFFKSKYSLKAAQRETILTGMQMITNRTSYNQKSCITFKQRTNEADYVYVYNDNGCFSYVNYFT